jgi:hypothetical protein
MNLIKSVIVLSIITFSNNIFVEEIDKKIKAIESKYHLQQSRTYHYKGNEILNSKCLYICEKCSVDISKIKHILCNKYLKRSFNHIPVSIEYWVFENNNEALRFDSSFSAKSPLTTCAILKLGYSCLVKENIIIFISGNPKQQLLLDSIYKDFKQL